MKELLKEILTLPETVDEPILADYFLKLISTVELESVTDWDTIMDIMCELSDKQWHNYKKFEEPLLSEIDGFVNKMLQAKTLHYYVLRIHFIIGSLGLTASYAIYKNLLASDLPQDTKALVIKVINEFGEDVSNPYLLFK